MFKRKKVTRCNRKELITKITALRKEYVTTVQSERITGVDMHELKNDINKKILDLKVQLIS